MDKAVIAKIQGFGFAVYMRRPEDTWLYFAHPDGKRLGYLQGEPFGGFSYSTVHQPNSRSGTGYRIGHERPDFTQADLEACFALAPDWARASELPTKWKDVDTFLKSSRFNGEYLKLEKVDA